MRHRGRRGEERGCAGGPLEKRRKPPCHAAAASLARPRLPQIVTGASGDIEHDDAYSKQSPSFTGTENYGYGYFTALNASHATWSFKTVQPDGNGPKDYSDHLTIIQPQHRLAQF